MKHGSAWRALVESWTAYGGARAVFLSSYAVAAALIMLLARRLWADSEWVELAVAILPTSLATSLASYMIFAAFGDPNIRSALVGRDGEPDYASFVSAGFAHMIQAQAACFMLALIAKYGWFGPWVDPDVERILMVLRFGYRGLGSWLLVYSLLLILPMANNVFRLIAAVSKAARTENNLRAQSSEARESMVAQRKSK